MTIENNVEQAITITMKGSRLEFLALASLDMNPVQPPLRSIEAAIQSLKIRVLVSHIITPILVVQKGSRYVIVDGHRRYAVALALGLTGIPAIILQDVDPIDMFIDLGYATKNFTGPTWFTIWAKCGNDNDERLKRCSSDIRKKIVKMVKVFGRGRAVDLALEGRVSPGAADLIVKLYEKRLTDLLEQIPPVTLRETGEWVLKHKCQRAIEDQSLIKKGYTKGVCQDIVSWIKNDQPWGGR